jgi:serine/threonine protein kinase
LELGEGHFGNVYFGTVKCKRTNRILPVAVKMVNSIEEKVTEDSSLHAKTIANRIETLNTELSIMAYIQRQKEGQHPNLIRLIGTTTTNDTNQFCLMTEYCEYGSLDLYLKEKYKNKLFVNEIPISDNISDDHEQLNNTETIENVRCFLFDCLIFIRNVSFNLNFAKFTIYLYRTRRCFTLI